MRWENGVDSAVTERAGTMGAALPPPKEPAPGSAAVHATGWRDKGLQVALAGLGVFLPFSPAGVSILLALLVLMVLLTGKLAWSSTAWRNSCVAAGLLLFAYIVVNTLATAGWSPANWRIVNKYHELAVFPFLLSAVALVSKPRWFLWGLVTGSTGYALVNWMAPVIPSLQEYLGGKRISAGFCLAVTAFLMLWQGGKRAWLWRCGAAFLAATVLFRIEGRTGHVVVLVLALLATTQIRPPRWRLVSLLAAPPLLLAMVLASPAIQQRFAETRDGLISQRLNEGTSTSIRMALLVNGWAVAKANQPLGVGYTRYAEAHEPVARERLAQYPGWDPQSQAWEVTANNPHNEYLMHLASGGIPALLLFLSWLGTAATTRDAAGRMSPVLLGVVLAFATGCLLNSLLMDFVEGHFYTAVLAWVMAAGRSGAVIEGGSA